MGFWEESEEAILQETKSGSVTPTIAQDTMKPELLTKSGETNRFLYGLGIGSIGGAIAVLFAFWIIREVRRLKCDLRN